jgi:hypothetical protein
VASSLKGALGSMENLSDFTSQLPVNRGDDFSSQHSYSLSDILENEFHWFLNPILLLVEDHPPPSAHACGRGRLRRGAFDCGLP